MSCTTELSWNLKGKKRKYFHLSSIYFGQLTHYSTIVIPHPGYVLFIYPHILWKTRCIKMSQPTILACPVINATFSGNLKPGNYDKCNKV